MLCTLLEDDLSLDPNRNHKIFQIQDEGDVATDIADHDKTMNPMIFDDEDDSNYVWIYYLLYTQICVFVMTGVTYAYVNYTYITPVTTKTQMHLHVLRTQFKIVEVLNYETP